MSESQWVVGFHAVLGLLESLQAVEVVWIQDGRRDHRVRAIVSKARAGGVDVRFVPSGRLKEIAGSVAHNGCAARTGPVSLREIDDCITPEGSPGKLLLLDDVADPQNLGAVIRSAAAFGVDGMIIAGPQAPPLGGAVAKAAAGHVHSVPLVRAKVAADVLVRLAGEGYWVFGADSDGEDLRQVKVPDRWVVCVGSEERGLRAKTRHRVDEWIAIPMAPGVESLNVSVATGVLLYAMTQGNSNCDHFAAHERVFPPE